MVQGELKVYAKGNFIPRSPSHKKREGRHEVLRSRGRNFYPKCDLKGFQTKRERAPSQLTWNEGVRGKGKK